MSVIERDQYNLTGDGHDYLNFFPAHLYIRRYIPFCGCCFMMLQMFSNVVDIALWWCNFMLTLQTTLSIQMLDSAVATLHLKNCKIICIWNLSNSQCPVVFLFVSYILNDPASYEVITVYSDSLTFCAWNTLMSDLFIGAHYLDWLPRV